MLGIIGGTGLYALDELKEAELVEVDTPYGKCSAPVTIGRYREQRVAFLPRHGSGHSILPSEINYRANIFALKSIGVTSLVSVSAVGSLREEIKPGELVLPNQYIDLTKRDRGATFFGNGLVAHISSAAPISSELTARILTCATKLAINIHHHKTYSCVEGPRLGTKAESVMLRTIGADIVGMTNCPEAFLAKEAQISYASICVVTDYDSWHADPAEHATVNLVMERYFQSLGTVISLLSEITSLPALENSCPSRSSLKDAVVSKDENLTPAQIDILSVLRR